MAVIIKIANMIEEHKKEEGITEFLEEYED
jgi:hypothetical protein